MEAAGLTVPGLGPGADRRAGRRHALLRAARRPASCAQLGKRGGFTPIPTDPRALSLDAIRARGRRGRAQRQRVDPRPRRRRLLPRVPRQDERHRSRHRRHDDEGASTAPSATASGLVIGNDGARRVLRGRQPVRPADGAGPGQHATAIDEMVVDFQSACLRTRYARVPVVAAPFGLALGGGAEVVLGCQTVRAAAELYVGCVEVGVGLIPAGGGCMELAARAVGARHRRSAVRPAVAACACRSDAGARARCRPAPRRRATSATCARADSVSMARETLIADAKQLALGLARAGYRPPPPRRIRVSARAAGDAASDAAQPARARTRISEHDARSAATWRASCRAAPCRRARRSASSTSSTSSARRSCRCAASRRPATACNTCSRTSKPLRN